MSYSFQVKAATKEAAKEAVTAKFDEVVASQPVHARDRAAVLANANTVIDLLADDDSKDVSVSVNGFVSWSTGTIEEAQFNTASVCCSAGHANRE
jgi:SHS2 domain-containing protein